MTSLPDVHQTSMSLPAWREWFIAAFCGRGTVLAVANELGLHAIGVDWSPKRCRQAQTLRTDQPPVPEDSDD